MWWYWSQRILVGCALAASIVVAADVVNVILGAGIEASLPPIRPTADAVSRSDATHPDTDRILSGNLFQPDRRGAQETGMTAALPAPLESTHRLVGTVTGSGAFGFAVLEELSSSAQSLYQIQDFLPGGAQLVEIGRYEIVLKSGEATYRLAVQEDLPAGAPSAAAPGADGVREVAANHFQIDRSKVDAVLSNLPQLLTQARLIPNFAGGRSDGFRLINIKPSSFYAQVGLQDGDVLRRVNGIEVNDAPNLLKAFELLRNEAQINLDLNRASQPTTLVYEIR